jgi:hypothetical protein
VLVTGYSVLVNRFSVLVARSNILYLNTSTFDVHYSAFIILPEEVVLPTKGHLPPVMISQIVAIADKEDHGDQP